MKISKADVFIFILAGGKGTRFWPLSRKNEPKQFLKIFNNRSMLQLTYSRCLSLTEAKNIYIVTSKGQGKDIKKQLPEIKTPNIIIEPKARGTAAAIALSAAKARQLSKNALMAVIPADQYIYHEKKFVQTIKDALNSALQSENLITLGIKPTFAATGYGYLKFSKKTLPKLKNTYKIEKFIEKPAAAMAKKYIKSNSYYFNSGMFIWRADVFMDELKKYMPGHHQAALKYLEAKNNKAKLTKAASFYKKLPTTSVDYGLMQKSKLILALKACFGWSDLGSPKSLEEIDIKKTKGNIIINAKHLSLNSKNCIIYGSKDKLIATLGLEDIIIIETADALLVSKKNNLQDVRKLVAKINCSKKMKKFA
jgi:mannose-1-phosphate guanylyltransferase